MGYKQQMVDSKPLRDLIRNYQLTVPQICIRAGISPSAVQNWLKQGKMPAYMQPACVGILASLRGEYISTAFAGDKGKIASDKSETWVIKVPQGQAPSAETILKMIGIQYRPLDEF